jgi:hypothetical protein
MLRKFLLGLLLTGVIFGYAQDKVVSRKQFFKDTAAIPVTIKTDLRKLMYQKKNPTLQNAKLIWQSTDGVLQGEDPIKIRLRGNNRRETCTLASLMVDFRDDEKSNRLKNLKEMKWVAPCNKGVQFEQYVIKEYLIYKIYNLLTDFSFKVRLLNITFEDEAGKVKGYTHYGFAIEPVDDLKNRVNSTEEKKKQFLQMQSSYNHTTMVALFQYMIGNTDWSVPNYHNVKLLIPKDSPYARPYIVPYDFDYAGAVNPPYAVPHETWPISVVTERYYMGFPRTFEEIKAVTTMMLSKKEDILHIIQDSPLLLGYHKKEMNNYISEFFNMIENDKTIKKVFVEGARRQ